MKLGYVVIEKKGVCYKDVSLHTLTKGQAEEAAKRIASWNGGEYYVAEINVIGKATVETKIEEIE